MCKEIPVDADRTGNSCRTNNIHRSFVECTSFGSHEIATVTRKRIQRFFAAYFNL